MKGSAEVVPLDSAFKTEIRRQIAIARTRCGPQDFALLCIEGSWGDTLDRKTLAMLLNRTGSI